MTEALFQDDAYLAECSARIVHCDQRGIELDRTVFYAASGGQAGDSGALVLPDGSEIRIADTRKGEAPGQLLHIRDASFASEGALPAAGTPVRAAIDWPRRYRMMRLHTCMHLLCAVVPAAVSGGGITPERAHLDFDIDMERLRKDEIEAKLNALIAAGHPVVPRWISDEELAARPELVRTMSVKPPLGSGRVRLLDIAGVDLQPCGGTHVRNSGEIGPVAVTRIRNEGRRNKRVIVAFASERA
ncbi:MAG: alanyl-tRNA editing protein [Burkholderiales bacterium]|nr:alanyl-tRNA editing protein [Burkholderiales bacterium]